MKSSSSLSVPANELCAHWHTKSNICSTWSKALFNTGIQSPFVILVHILGLVSVSTWGCKNRNCDFCIFGVFGASYLCIHQLSTWVRKIRNCDFCFLGSMGHPIHLQALGVAKIEIVIFAYCGSLGHTLHLLRTCRKNRNCKFCIMGVFKAYFTLTTHLV
ncbi:hypothetical protein C0J52_12202 [Blattella germanica]|nr:hypothetical protein C0J52_12202 [Blattella germanica]